MGAAGAGSLAQRLPVLARVVRDEVVESEHRGDAVVVDARGRVLFAAGDPALLIYPRSALKPLQALAGLGLLRAERSALADEALAIACASHTGSAEQQIEAAHLLALAGLDEEALGCPAALPRDVAALVDQNGAPTRLAHNCSGKHALLAWAEQKASGDASGYLRSGAAVQRAIVDTLRHLCGAEPGGPGVDGCGAPAWLLPLHALASAFAQIAAARHDDVRRIRDAMSARPDLIGGPGSDDTGLMIGDARVVAKSGAEAVMAAGLAAPSGAIGAAVKIRDGGQRAAGPVIASLLAAAGAAVPDHVRRPLVLGGGRPRGAVEPDPALDMWAP